MNTTRHALAAACLATLVLLPAPSRAATDPARIIDALAAPALAGRGAGTAGERAAAELMIEWLAAAGAGPAVPGWRQEVVLPAASGGGVSANVLGVVPGSGDLAGRWIIAGAHLDHLGRIDPARTDEPAAGEYYPGAGDNASGVAALLGALSTLTGDLPDRSRRSLLVCGFGAEEIGLVGSTRLAADLPVPAGAVDAMLNLDAVGSLRGGPLNVAGLETCARFTAMAEAAAGGVTLRAQPTGLMQSDHRPFVDGGIPALFLFTGAYPEMNSPADTPDAVDLDGVRQVAAVTAALLRDLLTAPGPFPFTPPLPVDAPAVAAGGNRQTWFGSVPDFSDADVAGYVIGAVAPEGPAARAGLRAGDVMTAMGGLPVTDLATFTTALRRHDPGDVVEVELRRDGRPLRCYVTLGDRSQRGR